MAQPIRETSTIHPTRQLILFTAASLFYERGFHGTSLRQLAEATDMQIPSIYYHIGDKETLLFDLMSETMRSLLDVVHEAISATTSPREALISAIKAHVMFHATHRKEVLIADSELRGLSESRRSDIVALRDQYEDIYKELINRGVADGMFRPLDAALATYAMMGMCTSIATWYRPTGRFSLEKIAEEYIEFITSGLSAT